MTEPINFACAVFGGVMQELFHWYSIREKLEEEKYDTMLKSVRYWAATVLFTVGTGIVSLIFLSTENVDTRTYFAVGVAGPLIMKRIGSTILIFLAGRGVPLGEKESFLKSYLNA